MDNPLLIIGALLAAYWYYSNYISPSSSATVTPTPNPLAPLPITPAPTTPGQIQNAVPSTAGPVLPAALVPQFSLATGQYTTGGQPTPPAFFQNGPTGGLTPAPEWNQGIGGNPSASGWLYADGSIYFETGPCAGQASGPPSSGWGGNSSMAALANGVPVSPTCIMQTIAGA